MPSGRHYVHVTDEAQHNASGVVQWLVEQGAAPAAERWLASFRAACSSLQTLPLRCPHAVEAEELGIDLRELWFGRRSGQYRVLFVVEGQDVYVLYVRRDARDAVSAEDLPASVQG